MKAIFSLLLVLLFNFSNELFFNLKCESGYARVCGCTRCWCTKIPKCPKGEKAVCRSTFFFSGCLCEKKNTNFDIKEKLNLLKNNSTNH